MTWQFDRTYYYLSEAGIFSAGPLSHVPEDTEDYATIYDAVVFFQGLGFQGRSAHTISSPFHALCLQVIARAIDLYGRKYSVWRGQQVGSLALKSHKILYGSPVKEVAEWYGPAESYEVWGLLTFARRSVLAPDDDNAQDPEVIFLPGGILQ